MILSEMTFDPTVVAGIAAAAAGLLGWYSGRAAQRRAFRLSATSYAADWQRDLRTWASEVVDALSEAAYLAERHGGAFGPDDDRNRACRYRLSALIDRGRFFLPNYNPDDVGQEKASAFRGIRHPALDYIVAAHDALDHP